jgi:hypothetical protein
VHVGKFFARNLGGLIHARKSTGPAREGESRTPSMHVGEKSDEAILPWKRPNKGGNSPRRSWREGPHPRETGQAAVVRTLSRVATSIPFAALRRIAGVLHNLRGFTSKPAEWFRTKGRLRIRKFPAGRSARRCSTATPCNHRCGSRVDSLRGEVALAGARRGASGWELTGPSFAPPAPLRSSVYSSSCRSFTISTALLDADRLGGRRS